MLTLRIGNNSKFVRGKKRAIEHIENVCLAEYDGRRQANGEYVLTVSYVGDDELDNTVNELLNMIAREADDRHCFSESDARMRGTDRQWG